MIFGASGCWQEIQYKPEQRKQSTADLAPKGGAARVQPKVVEQDSSVVSDVAPAELAASIPSDEVAATVGSRPDAPAVDVMPDSATSVAVDSLPLAAIPTELGGDAQDAVSMPDPTGDPQLQPVLGPELPAETALSVWKLSSDWSMAAALQAKGKDVNAFGSRLENAREEGQWLGLQLPPLPDHAAGAERLQANLNFLLDSGGPQLARQMGEKIGTRAASLSELAINSNVLLLSYSPRWTRLEPVVVAIQQAAERSGLPAEIWGELVELLGQRVEFKEVKTAVFELHARARGYLAERVGQ